MNNYELLGRLGQDAEVKSLDNWQVLTFSLAIDRGYYSKEKSEFIEQTEWIRVNKFYPKDKPVKLADHLKKGVWCYVSGIPKAEAWKDKEGNPQGAISVSGNQIKVLFTKFEGNSQAPSDASKDDLPW